MKQLIQNFFKFQFCVFLIIWMFFPASAFANEINIVSKSNYAFEEFTSPPALITNTTSFVLTFDGNPGQYNGNPGVVTITTNFENNPIVVNLTSIGNNAQNAASNTHSAIIAGGGTPYADGVLTSVYAANSTSLTITWTPNLGNPNYLTTVVNPAVLTGAFGGSATATISGLDVPCAAGVTSNPANKEICLGSSTTFNVVASTATSFQWQVDAGSGFQNISNNASYSGATTSVLSVTNAGASLNGYLYRAAVTFPCGIVNTPSATLTIAPFQLVDSSSNVTCYTLVQDAISAGCSSFNTVVIPSGNYGAQNLNSSACNGIFYMLGESPGCATFTDWTLSSLDTVEIELEGTSACTEYDQYEITGTLDLGGATLDLQFLNNYTS
jgi:hypothetical protein